jgi:hypothetical protein
MEGVDTQSLGDTLRKELDIIPAHGALVLSANRQNKDTQSLSLKKNLLYYAMVLFYIFLNDLHVLLDSVLSKSSEIDRNNASNVVSSLYHHVPIVIANLSKPNPTIQRIRTPGQTALMGIFTSHKTICQEFHQANSLDSFTHSVQTKLIRNFT